MFKLISKRTFSTGPNSAVLESIVEAAKNSTGFLDFRSDTVSRPGVEMRHAMAHAVVGDDVYTDCPTTLILQQEIAALFGKEDSLFVPSGC